ncbi:MAG: eukaryotic-like serine/threonine-protein kinase [Chthoniobacter sp.]|nr:eukaryotic-like serine/threonine-protein kinase [Chthoniobacter sp.]
MNEANPPMPDDFRCPQCRAALPVNAPGGLCPACLLKQGAAGDTVTGGAMPFTSPSAEELAPLFPQLEVLQLIGKGGMGAVYKARQRELDRVVALKILPPGIGDAPGFAERFAREAKALAKLNHPGIVTIHDFGRADGLYFFVMEFVDGVNLRQLLHGERIAPREALAIVPQICDALQFAHDHGIVHRDIKPENILMDRRGRVKVADFGLAKLVEAGAETLAGSSVSDPTLTEAGKVLGTPSYMAPEQTEHPDEVDHRADIYALGVVFYQMLTGELPDKQLQPPSRKVQIDVRLDEVVLRALEKNPDLRYSQASIFKTEVETIAGSPQESSTPTPRPPVLHWRDRWLWDTGYVVAMALVPCILAVILFGASFPVIGKAALLFLPLAVGGLICAVIFGRVGYCVRQLKAAHLSSNTEVAEALIFRRPLQSPGIAVLHADRLELIRVKGERLVVPLADIASISEVRWFNGLRLFWKRGFELGLKNGERIGLAVPEPFGRRWRAILSGGSLPEIPPDSFATKLSDEPPRFSRTAIAGAVWSLFGWFLLGTSAVTGLIQNYKLQTMEAFEIPKVWFVFLFVMGISAPFCTTILGWVSVSQIRRSAGKLYGMGLAVFDGLFFPLLALDALIGFAFLKSIEFHAHADEFTRHPKFIFLWAIMLLVIGAADYWILKSVWRRVNKPLHEPRLSSNDFTAAGSSQSAPSNRLWKMVAIVVGLLLLVPAIIISAFLIPAYFAHEAPGHRGDSTQFTSANAAFGLVREQTIHLKPDENSFFSFDGEKLVAPPIDFNPRDYDEPGTNVDSTKLWKWLAEHGVDLFVQRKDGRPILAMSDMTIAIIEEKEFDRLTPARLQNHEGLRAAIDSSVHPQVQSVTRGAFGGKATVAFRTRYDVTGLLQVEGVQSNPPGVKIRYKLLQNLGEKFAAQSQPTLAPVIEREVKEGLDLDNGRLAELPESVTKKNDITETILDAVAWMEREGMDVFADTRTHFFGVGMRSIVRDKRAWENLSASQVIAILDASITKPSTYVPLEPLVKEATYIFQTREGGKGILQILGVTDEGVKIRYRLTQAAGK